MSAEKPIVYFFSDFGPDGPYTGQVESVIAVNSNAKFINLLCNAPRTDPFHSAFLLAALFKELPVKKGFLLAVVDPGVGTERLLLKVTINEMVFIAPDNGLLSRLVSQYPQAVIEQIMEKPGKLSDSFHARDWFAPLVTQLVNRQKVKSQRLSFEKIQGYNWPDEIGEIIYIDHYGNLVTGLKSLSLDQCVLANGQEILNARTFSEVPEGHLFWYVNSMGLIEIAANRQSAAEHLEMSVGQKVETRSS